MAEISSGLERRITLRLLAYWEKLRQGRDMPVEEDIDPDDIKDLWDNCFLIHINDLKKDGYNFTYIGDAIVQAYRGGITEDDPDAIISPNAASISTHYTDIIANPKPIVDEGEFHNLHDEVVKYRQCLLPLGRNGKVEAIFGGMRYKIFTNQ